MASQGLGRALGAVARGLGGVLESVGAGLQGSLAYTEAVTTQKPLVALASKKPVIGKECFVAPNATLIGDVTVGDKSSLFYGVVARGDVNYIKIGKLTSLQDNVVIHVAKNNAKGDVLPTIIGDKVIVGQNATLHACTVGNGSLIGMGSTIMDGAKVENGAIVGGGSLVTSGTTIPSGQIWTGNPAKFMRTITAEEASFLERAAEHMNLVAVGHAAENSKTFEEILMDDEARVEQLSTDPDFYDHLGILPPQGVPTTIGPDGRVRVDDGSDPRLG